MLLKLYLQFIRTIPFRQVFLLSKLQVTLWIISYYFVIKKILLYLIIVIVNKILKYVIIKELNWNTFTFVKLPLQFQICIPVTLVVMLVVTTLLPQITTKWSTTSHALSKDHLYMSTVQESSSDIGIQMPWIIKKQPNWHAHNSN